MIDENLIKLWAQDYDALKDELKKAPGKFDITIPKVIEACASKSKIMSEVFKELAAERKEDGNIVPVIMGYFMAENVAQKLMGALTAGAIGNMSPGAMTCMVKSILYNDLASQFAMTLWENAQKGWIDDFLKDTEST